MATASITPPQPNVLIVDGQAQNRTLLTSVLRDRYRVTSVSTGTSAFNLLQSNLFDVVLMDVDVDGLDLLTKIRNQPKTYHLPVILMSAEKGQMAQGLEMGADDYILKPIDWELARARVNAQVRQKRLIEDQEAAIRELEKIQQDHKRLIRMVTHDLKHPLANLRMAEIILRRYMTNESSESLKIMDGIVSSLDSMQEVIDDFFGAFTLEELKTELRPISVETVVFDIAMQYAATALKKGIDLKPLRESGWIKADGKRLTQVIGNLVSNAIKYSPMGSTVNIYAEHGQDVIRICVSDQGVGIPVEERSRLFTEFGKLSTRPTGYESSTGLGLWIVKNLTEAMGGRVGADFPERGGSIFWVELPVSPVPQHLQAGV